VKRFRKLAVAACGMLVLFGIFLVGYLAVSRTARLTRACSGHNHSHGKDDHAGRQVQFRLLALARRQFQAEVELYTSFVRPLN
jgi:hypothetical protein